MSPSPARSPSDVSSAPAPGDEQVEFSVLAVDGGNVWTTVGRAVPVAIAVPDAYDAQAVAQLLPALVAHDPVEPVASAGPSSG